MGPWGRLKRNIKKMNVQNIINEIKRENEEEKIRIKQRISRAAEEVKRVKKDFLKIDKGIEKIILFGSLAEESIESINFDIDIAVKSEKYYQLVGRALQSEFKIDVVDLDSVHERIKKNIIQYGKVIYEKRQN